MIVRVKNLNRDLNKKEIKGLFRVYGAVKCAVLRRDKAFVEMPNDEEAISAACDLNGQIIGGRKLKVDLPKHDRTSTICRTNLGFLRLL